ncbi:MAG: hypothetical protein MNPFHGCM_00270 [Gemmatimonadaceae bacterium]|nr:hypothetical protein [Gemmatimonadaceae bacterium]
MYRQALLATLIAMSTAACASGGNASATGALTSRQSDIITRSEIAETQGLLTAWDAVQRLRPRFLRNAGRTSVRGSGDNRAIVRVDDNVAGLPEVLRSIDISEVMEIRYYSAVDATARFGGMYGRGIIHVITRQR